MNELIMMVGVPGSGKSTWVDSHYSGVYSIHSSDALRMELFGDENCQAKNDVLFEELNNRIIHYLECGIPCVYDATNLNRKRRMAFLNMIKQHKINCRKICVIMLTPPDECYKNNDNRDRKLDHSVIHKKICQFECPYFYEVWDEIKVITSEPYDLPYDKCYGFGQDNAHHSKTLSDHMFDATIYCRKRDFPEEVTRAAYYHDIGKLFTKSFVDKKGEVTEDAHYYDHHNYGAYIYLCHIIPAARSRQELIDKYFYTGILINWHMRPFMAWYRSEAARNRDKRLLGDKIYNDILMLHEADIHSR